MLIADAVGQRRASLIPGPLLSNPALQLLTQTAAKTPQAKLSCVVVVEKGRGSSKEVDKGGDQKLKQI